MWMVGAAAAVSMALVWAWERWLTVHPVKFHTSWGTTVTLSPTHREDPMDPSAYIRPKLGVGGQIEGLLRCRRMLVEECEWATRHL